jgi:acetyl-CoA carboxylase beta subunit
MAKNKKAGWNGFSLKPRKEMPAGLWMACSSCQQMLYRKTVEENLNVCPDCGCHFRVDGPTRVRQLADEGTLKRLEPTWAAATRWALPGAINPIKTASGLTRQDRHA